jgi:TrmH family RNA methyltransferase
MISITSLQNPRVKRVIKLNDRRARDEARQTVVEGVREVRLALGRGIVPVEAYICPELIDGAEAETAASHLRAIAATGMGEMFLVTPEVFAKMAYRGEGGGLLLVIPYRPIRLDDLSFRGAPFLVVIEEA